jgi:hypothetical protein
MSIILTRAKVHIQHEDGGRRNPRYPGRLPKTSGPYAPQSFNHFSGKTRNLAIVEIRRQNAALELL